MKKIFILTIIMTATLSMIANAQNRNSKELSADIRIEDEARMAMETSKDEDGLLQALANSKEKKLRDAVLYSLGKIKSKKGYSKIESVAMSEMDNSPAAVLALAFYKTEEAKNAMQMLVSKKCKTAQTALFISEFAQNDFPVVKQNDFDRYDGLDENTKVSVLGYDSEFALLKSFLIKLKPTSQREVIALCFALSKKADADCAEVILEKASENPELYNDIAVALAACKDSDKAIIKGINEGVLCAIVAAKIRASGESEDALLNRLQSNPNKEVFEALTVVASEKTLKKYTKDFLKIKKSDLNSFVKILSASISRVDKKSADYYAKELQNLCENSDKIYITAIEKILKAQ